MSRNKLTTEEFIKKANIIHNNYYDYSKTKYTLSKEKIVIICPKHGEFNQKANNHLNGQGCPICKLENLSKKHLSNTEEFIKKANIIHNNYYDYSKTKYITARDIITIICPKHGEFNQISYYHLNGNGCPKCALEKTINSHLSNTEEFIKKANIIHNNYYDYSKTKYTTNHSNLIIICPKHGEFTQMALHHLKGCGCPKCAFSKGEKEIEKYLLNKKIIFEEQKTFADLKDKSLLSYDFFIPSKKLLIEYNGEQHYKPIKFFGGLKKFKIQQRHDFLKKEYAKKNNYIFLEIKYNDNIIEKLKENIT